MLIHTYIDICMYAFMKSTYLKSDNYNNYNNNNNNWDDEKCFRKTRNFIVYCS
jgi:hypothetical protein